jgi:hypothetical protein
MIFLRGRVSYLYNSEIVIQGLQRKLRECLGFLEDDSNDLGEIPSTRRSLWEGFLKVTKALASLQSQSNSSQGGLNIVFWFWQLSSNSAKPPQPALCGFVLCLELSNILCDSPNSTMSYLHTRP